MKVPLGLWVDCPPRAVLAPGYLAQLRELGFSTLAVMIDGPGKADWRWMDDEVFRVCAIGQQLDLEVVLTVWPEPSEPALDELGKRLQRLLPFGVAGLEVDCEGQWKSRQYRTLSARLVEILGKLRCRYDARLELTTHTGHRECTERALVAPSMDCFCVQAYSVQATTYASRRRLYRWDCPVYGPGIAQRRAVRLAQRVPGVAEGRVGLTMGLAAWEQSWPGHTVAEALQTAYDAAIEAGPREVRLWSSKWIVGSRSNTEMGAGVREWLRHARRSP